MKYKTVKYKTMKDLAKGESAKVAEVLTEGSMRRRLQDMGLVKGTLVQCLHKGPGGDPAAFLIRGAVIAIRSEDSETITVVENK